MTVLEIRNELSQKIVPVGVYVQRFHVEVHNIYNMLLLLAVRRLSLPLVVLKDDRICFIKRIFIVEKGLY
jgi:hypothetical protein